MKAAIASGISYDYFLYVRDDNRFLAPFRDILSSAMNGVNLSYAGPAVAVDNHCGFGSLSDKIYLANREGAALLFGANEPVFISFIAAWAGLAFNYTTGQDPYPLQPEWFYSRYMSHHKFLVTQRDFCRIDNRYVKKNGGLVACIPYRYACCANPDLLSKLKLRPCPHKNPRRRRDGPPATPAGPGLTPAWRPVRTPAELKGSVGEGPNHLNHSNHSNPFKIGIFRNFSFENSRISENFNIF